MLQDSGELSNFQAGPKKDLGVLSLHISGLDLCSR